MDFLDRPNLPFRLNLAEVPHLGCLNPLALVNASRLDYTLLWGGVALELKKSHPGLGLGSKIPGSDPEARAVLDAKISGLELIQLWTILTNWGHLFGTFATERALLFHLAGDRTRRAELLDTVSPSLRDSCERIFSRRQLGRFFYAIACVKVSALPTGDAKDLSISALSLFLDKKHVEMEGLRWAFKRSRQIAMIRLHAILGLGSVWGLSDRSAMIRRLLPGDGIEGSPHHLPEPRLSELLNGIQNFETFEFFENPRATAIVLQHMREFRKWLSLHSGLSLAELVPLLATRPHDWPHDSRELQHFARFELPAQVPQEEWLDEVRAWRAELDSGGWKTDTFSISPSGNSLLCDYYRTDTAAPLEVSSATTVMRQVAQHVQRSWRHDDVSSRRLWLSVAQFGVKVLDLSLPPTHCCVLRPVPASFGSVGLAVLAPNAQHALARARIFMDRTRDEQRVRELDAVATVFLERCAPPVSAPCLFFLGRIIICARTSREQHCELDGLVGIFESDAITWHVFECKKKRASGGKGQMRRLADLLHLSNGPFDTSEIDRDTTATGKSFYISFKYPRDGC